MKVTKNDFANVSLFDFDGKKMGVVRSTFWIDPDGKIVRHWPSVPDAEGHVKEVAAAIAGM